MQQLMHKCNAIDSLVKPLHVSHTWRGSFMHLQYWAARYNTGLLIMLTPKGAVSSVFFPFHFISSKYESSNDLNLVTEQVGYGQWS